MRLEGLTIGVGFTGSFCTYDKIFIELENLVKEGANVHTIFSDVSQNIDCRFGNSEEFMKKAYELTGNKPIVTIEEAEPFGPKGIADIIIIAPCTGNTAAKLANGITDSPVLMAAKGHLRNDKPLVISKNIYFVPFGQDNCKAKPNSMIAHTELIIPTIELALENKQLQPVIKSPHQ